MRFQRIINAWTSVWNPSGNLKVDDDLQQQTNFCLFHLDFAKWLHVKHHSKWVHYSQWGTFTSANSAQWEGSHFNIFRCHTGLFLCRLPSDFITSRGDKTRRKTEPLTKRSWKRRNRTTWFSLLLHFDDTAGREKRSKKSDRLKSQTSTWAKVHWLLHIGREQCS